MSENWIALHIKMTDATSEKNNQRQKMQQKALHQQGNDLMEGTTKK